MGSRSTRNGAESAYKGAEAWVDHGLRSDDSLFTPGTAIWSRELLEIRTETPCWEEGFGQ